MRAVEERVCDQSVLKLLRVMLRAGVMEDGQVRRAGHRDPAGRGDHAPNAKGNFCFEVTLGYRRLERGR